jgi:hypothetical protein
LNQQEEQDPSSTLTIPSSMRSEGGSDYASETGFRARAIFAGMSEQPSSSELLLFNAHPVPPSSKLARRTKFCNFSLPVDLLLLIFLGFQ